MKINFVLLFSWSTQVSPYSSPEEVPKDRSSFEYTQWIMKAPQIDQKGLKEFRDSIPLIINKSKRNFLLDEVTSAQLSILLENLCEIPIFQSMLYVNARLEYYFPHEDDRPRAKELIFSSTVDDISRIQKTSIIQVVPAPPFDFPHASNVFRWAVIHEMIHALTIAKDPNSEVDEFTLGSCEELTLIILEAEEMPKKHSVSLKFDGYGDPNRRYLITLAIFPSTIMGMFRQSDPEKYLNNLIDHSEHMKKMMKSSVIGDIEKASNEIQSRRREETEDHPISDAERGAILYALSVAEVLVVSGAIKPPINLKEVTPYALELNKKLLQSCLEGLEDQFTLQFIQKFIDRLDEINTCAPDVSCSLTLGFVESIFGIWFAKRSVDEIEALDIMKNFYKCFRKRTKKGGDDDEGPPAKARKIGNAEGDKQKKIDHSEKKNKVEPFIVRDEYALMATIDLILAQCVYTRPRE